MNLVDKYIYIENGKVKPNQLYFHIILKEEWGPGDITSYPLEVIIVKKSDLLEDKCIKLYDLTVKYPELVKIFKELKLEENIRSNFIYTEYDNSQSQEKIVHDITKRMTEKGFKSIKESEFNNI